MKNRNLFFLFGLISLILTSCHTDMTVVRFFAPELAEAGEEIEVTKVYGNLGKGETADENDEGYNTQVYLSLDSYLSSDDELIEETSGTFLFPGQKNEDLSSVVIPSNTPTGNYYLLYNVNKTFQVLENNVANNLASRRVHIEGTSNTGSDLAAINFQVEQNDLLGDDLLTVFWTAYNFGQTNTAATQVKYYLSEDAVLNPTTDLCIGNQTVSSLEANEKKDYAFRPLIPNENIGTQFIIISIDANNAVPEFNELNNTVMQRIYVRQRRPDLSIFSFESPIGVQTNEPILLTTKISNAGGTAVSGNFQLHYILSENATLGGSDDVILETFSLGGISTIGGVVTYNHSIIIPQNISQGTYHIFVVADPENLIPEYSTGNNRKMLRLCVHDDFNNLINENSSEDHRHNDARQSISAPIFSRNSDLTQDYLEGLVANQIEVYPNPAAERTNVAFEISRDAEVSIFIRDMKGQSVFQFTGKMQEGKNLQSIPLNNFAGGTYIVQVIYEKEMFSEIIVVE